MPQDDHHITQDGLLIDSETGSLSEVYRELLRIEQHWTDQIQNQQQRNNAILGVNSVLLALFGLGAPTLLRAEGSLRLTWLVHPFVLSLIFLALGVIFGLFAFWPQLKISGSSRGDGIPVAGKDVANGGSSNQESPSRKGWFREHPIVHRRNRSHIATWLNSQVLWEKVQDRNLVLGPDLLVELCSSLASNADGNRKHSRIQVLRRRWMNCQIACITLALSSLMVALVGLGLRSVAQP